MTKPVLLAGLLGGLLGAIGGFALNRAFPVKPLPDKPHEARPIADDLLAKLRNGKEDEFLAAVRPGYAELDAAAFESGIRQPLLAAREGFAKEFGGPGEFEFFRESAPAPAPGLARFTYLERFPRGCLVWLLYAYKGADGWRVVAFKYMKPEAVFEALK